MAGIIVADPRRSPTVRQGADLHPTRPRRPGEVFVLFHYGRGAQSANQHTWYARDPISHQPQLKSSPVSVRRLSFGEPEPWLLERLAELNGENTEPFAARTFA